MFLQIWTSEMKRFWMEAWISEAALICFLECVLLINAFILLGFLMLKRVGVLYPCTMNCGSEWSSFLPCGSDRQRFCWQQLRPAGAARPSAEKTPDRDSSDKDKHPDVSVVWCFCIWIKIWYPAACCAHFTFNLLIPLAFLWEAGVYFNWCSTSRNSSFYCSTFILSHM